MKTLLRSAAGAALALSLGVFSSCYPFMGALPSGAADGPAIQHVPYSGTFSYSVDTGTTPRDVYFVFTNPDRSKDVSSAPAIASGSITVNGRSLPAPAPQALPSVNSAPTTITERIAEFNRNPRAYITSGGIPGPQASLVSTQPANLDSNGPVPPASTADFLLSQDGISMISVPSTCRRVRTIVDPRDGKTHALSIWVADANWGTITQSMVDLMADRFMKTSGTDDIYFWDTSVVGEPWGPQNYSDLISWDTNDTITILLADLNVYYSGSVTVGYFWAKDNYTVASYSGSNQRIMFYIDAKLYSTVDASRSETVWAESNHWPKLVRSTLAHEFQHMIQFYQKQVVLGATQGADTWINEMCSMIMEDLVADSTKLNVEGPRGVPLAVTDGSAGTAGIVDGRIPDFNRNSSSSLVRTTNFDLTDYSVAYAFGAWLARNYGGAALLRRIVQCQQTDESAVVNAVIQATGNQKETLAGLLERWAAAVLLSDTTSAPSGYKYNIGSWFISSIGGLSFDLGSIDFFNYIPGLTVYSPTSALPTTSYHSANLYYRAAASLGGTRTWQVTVPNGVLMNVVIK